MNVRLAKSGKTCRNKKRQLEKFVLFEISSEGLRRLDFKKLAFHKLDA